MPASRSPNRDTDRPSAARRTRVWPLILFGMLAALTFVVIALPAGIVGYFLPPMVQAADLSGSIWHGSMRRIVVGGRDAGGLEWRLHPASMLTLSPVAELHWVKSSFVIDGTARLDRHGIRASGIRGGGPIEDLTDLGIAAGWRGTAEVAVRELDSDYVGVTALTGDLEVSELESDRIGGGAPLGSYVLHFADDAIAADGGVAGTLKDLGGPIRVQGTLKIAPAQRVGTLSATVREGAEVAPALRSELDSLAQMRGRNPDGGIPVDLEFTF